MDEWPVFTGPDAQCVKCGGVGADVQYLAAGTVYPSQDGGYETISGGPESLIRTCRTCGWVWQEAPLTGGGGGRVAR